MRDPFVPRRRIIRKQIKQYKILYRNRKGNEVTVTTFDRPQKHRQFNGHTYTAVKAQVTTEEIIIMAKSAKQSKGKNEITDTELEELESLEDLDEEVEVEEPVVESDATDDDTDETPAPKKGKGKKGKKAKDEDDAPKESRSRTTDGKVGTAELASHFDVPARTLRMVLRKHEIPKDSETGRYEWDSLNDKTVKKIGKLIADGEHKTVVSDSLAKLKEGKAKEKAEKDAKGGKDKSGKKGKGKGKKDK